MGAQGGKIFGKSSVEDLRRLVEKLTGGSIKKIQGQTADNARALYAALTSLPLWPTLELQPHN
jgi:hypothetical protein